MSTGDAYYVERAIAWLTQVLHAGREDMLLGGLAKVLRSLAAAHGET